MLATLFLVELAVILLIVLALYLRVTARWKRGLLRECLYVVLSLAPLAIAALIWRLASHGYLQSLPQGFLQAAFAVLAGWTLGAVLLRALAPRANHTAAPAAAAPRKPGMMLLVWLGAAVLLWVGTGMALHRKASALLDSVRAEARAVRESCARARAHVRREPARDAAPLYAAAFEGLLSDTEDRAVVRELLPNGAFKLAGSLSTRRDTDPPGARRQSAESLDGEDQEDREPGPEDFQRFFGRHAKAMALLREAASFPTCRLAPDEESLPEALQALEGHVWSDLPMLLERHLSDAMEGGRALEALQDAQDVIGHSEQLLRNGPCAVLRFFRGVAFLGAALPAMAAALSHPSMRIEDYEALEALDEPSYSELLQACLDVEELDALAAFHELYEAGPAWRRLLLLPFDIQAYREFAAACRSSVAGHLLQGHDAQAAHAIPTPAGGLAGIFAFAGEPERMASAVTRATATRRVLRAGIAMYRFRAKKSAFPSKLEELVPEFLEAVPEDPYARGPLRFRRMGDDSWAVYSVGPDGADDGGEPGADDCTAPRGPSDVVFRRPATLPGAHGDT